MEAKLIHGPTIRILDRGLQFLYLRRVVMFNQSARYQDRLAVRRQNHARRLLLTNNGVISLGNISVFPRARSLHQASRILLYLVLAIRLSRSFLRVSSYFRDIFPFVSTTRVCAPICTSISLWR